MKPFNLERAFAGDKVVTRDGREVTQLTKFDAKGESIVGVIDQYLHIWFESGGYFRDNKKDSGIDLFMAPKTVKRWVNFYDRYCESFPSELSAKELAVRKDAIAIAVPVEFEEGYNCEVQP